MEFIEIVIDSMKKQGITAYKLCKDIGMSQQTFSNWKNGKMPALDKAVKIILYLGLSADEIFGIKKENNSLTSEEQELLEAYRNAEPMMKAGARKLLDLPELPEPAKLREGKLSACETGKEAI